MPLTVVADASELHVPDTDTFLIFYSSRDEDGKLWCPDCVAVDGLVQEKFSPADGPSGLIVHVGQRDEWKTPSNTFRGEPWKIQYIPTIIRIRDGKDDVRLVDSDEIIVRLGSILSK